MFPFKYRRRTPPPAQTTSTHRHGGTREPRTEPLPTPPGDQAPDARAASLTREWLLADAERLETAAAENDARIRDLIDEAATYRTVGAGYRRAARHIDPAPAHPGPEPEVAYDAPDPGDAWGATWPLEWRPSADVAAAAPPCGCDPLRGQSCAACDGADELLSPRPFAWRPPSAAEAAGWGDTQMLPLASGDAR